MKVILRSSFASESGVGSIGPPLFSHDRRQILRVASMMISRIRCSLHPDDMETSEWSVKIGWLAEVGWARWSIDQTVSLIKVRLIQLDTNGLAKSNTEGNWAARLNKDLEDQVLGLDFYVLKFNLTQNIKTQNLVTYIGSCWLRQWKLPKPQTMSVESIPITLRSLNNPCKISKAIGSFFVSL